MSDTNDLTAANGSDVEFAEMLGNWNLECHNRDDALKIARLEAEVATLTRELEAAREESITKVLSEAVIDGYRFDIRESFGGWIANYYWRNDGHRNGKNYGGIGETPQEAIQNAQNNLRKAAGEVGNE